MESTSSLPPSPVQLILAGGTAGIVAKTACAPLERIKILNQLGHSHGLTLTFKTVNQQEGIKGLWKGNFTNCLRVFPAKGILFGTNDLYKELLRKYFENKNLTGVGAGSLAGWTAVICTYPLDLARTRIQSQIGKDGKAAKYSTITSTILHTVKDEGFFALYRGINPTLFGALPFEGIKFGVYDFLTRRHKDDPQHISITWKLTAGALAGLSAHLVMFPNDTVRRRLQTQGLHGKPRVYTGAIHCYKTLFKEHGITIFYRGFSTNILRAGPNTAIQFATFEAIKTYFFPYAPTSFNPGD